MIGIFLISLLFGFVFLSASHIFDFGHDTDFGHDHGGDGDSDGLMSNLFTLRNLFLFVTGFGGIGAIAHYLGASDFVASLWGIGIGIIFALLGALLYNALRGQQSNSLTRLDTLVGRDATVTTAIPSEGRGEISALNEQGVRVTVPAQSRAGAIAATKLVRITSVVGSTAIVEAVS